MRWTKRHSRNAVAAKERQRLAAASAEPKIVVGKVYHPRKPKPDFIIRIEDRFGDRIQISVNRYMGKVMTSTGQSARQLCRGIEQLITKSA
jgi:hypothetical protein